MAKKYVFAMLLLVVGGCIGGDGTEESRGAPVNSGDELARQSTIPVGCSHSLCQGDWSSPPVAAGCGMYGCTAAICADYQDPYCCVNHWDPICVAEMLSICQRTCDCAAICTPGSSPPYPDACEAARKVIGNIPDCGWSWDQSCVDQARVLGACPG
jgi:hypothetical protein